MSGVNTTVATRWELKAHTAALPGCVASVKQHTYEHPLSCHINVIFKCNNINVFTVYQQQEVTKGTNKSYWSYDVAAGQKCVHITAYSSH